MILETERLLLREYTMADYDALSEILTDPETMQHYPKPYDAAGVTRWINWSLENYQKYGFGLWAIVLKETGEFIGDCGITLQPIDGEWLPEVGYHIHKSHWRKGFAREAAAAVRDWAFTHTDYPAVYSYMAHSNVPSYRTAQSVGMQERKEYADEKNGTTLVYSITRAEWEALSKK